MTLHLEQVSKTYRQGRERIHALQEISVDIHPGAITALVGPSGSGKSTLLNIVSGWEIPDTGRVTWDAGDLRDGLGWADVAVVPQRLGLLDDLSVAENVELPWILAGRPTHTGRPRVEELLAWLEIAHLADRLPGDTSLGEQQRTSIARALALSPRLILADEPTGNQDTRRGDLILDALRAAAEEGAICLIATHDLDVLDRCHRTIGLDHGALVTDETRSTVDRERSMWGRKT